MSNPDPAKGTAYARYRHGDGLWRPPRREGLARVLAKAGYGARPRTEAIVCAGRVRVDGDAVTDPGHPVEPGSQVSLDGSPLREAPRRYLMIHKPPGYECQGQPGGSRWLGRLYPPDAIGLEPAGRLDVRGAGLVLASNDLRWNTHVAESDSLERRYEIVVSGTVTPMMLDVFRGGLTLPSRGTFRPRSVEVLEDRNDRVRLLFTVQGKHARKIRAAFLTLRCQVEATVQVGLGALELGDLRRGMARDLTPLEYAGLVPADERGSPS